MDFQRVAQLRTASQIRAYLEQIGARLSFDESVESGPDSPLARPLAVHGHQIGNRFCTLPMEGWDANPDGSPTELVRRRWQHFGISGAKLIWGGEAVAVRHDGRANPNQLAINEATVGGIAALRESLVAVHRERFGRTDDLYIGLQLTHSGRFCRPNDKKRLEPFILYHHPLLDRRFDLPDDYPVMTDGEIWRLIDDFVKAAVLAQKAGFDFVDLKHCHGYLGHEFLSAVDREGNYGGSLENRTRFLREVIAGVRAHAPGLEIGVRLSAFDWMPFRKGAEGQGVPESLGQTQSADGYRYAFGADHTGMGIDLTETRQFLDLLVASGVRLVCLTAGCAYYNPHILRPALFPPSDGYLPPEDPLVGVARQISVVAELKRYRPDLTMVGSAYSYLQEWLPNVAQHAVRTGGVDSVGLGRMMLTYPEIVADILEGRPLQRKRLCRTFSDCTTAPRNGLVSGCYPLDEFYKKRPDSALLAALKHKDRE